MQKLLGRARELTHRAGQMAGVAAGALGLTGDHPITGPLYAQVSVSDPCDQRCVMCCYHPPSEERPLLEQFGGKRPGVLDYDTFAATIDDLHRLGTRQIDLVGRGEPLLNPRVADMIALAKERGFTVTMISNGARLTAERARALVDAGLDRYRVSLDAGTADTYPRVHASESPESFRRITQNLRRLAETRADLGRASPHLSISFTIGALNYRELVSMVETVHAIGADAGHFQHTLLLTPEGEAMRLDDDAYAELTTSLLPAAQARAAALGVETNLRAFAASPPTYRLDAADEGPAVVPCYIGSFFTVVLGNGSVMPCCQTQRPIGSLHDQSFDAIWRGDGYRAFRRAARELPAPSPALETCECDRCYFRPHNITIHNALHPLSRIPVRREEQLFSVDHLLRMSRLDRR